MCERRLGWSARTLGCGEDAAEQLVHLRQLGGRGLGSSILRDGEGGWFRRVRWERRLFGRHCRWIGHRRVVWLGGHRRRLAGVFWARRASLVGG